MSSIINSKTDWYEDLDTYTENRIVEVLETEDYTDDITLRDIGYNTDTFDSESFSVWADL